MAAKRVVFIHGLFVTYRCWDQWAGRFSARGWQATAVPWPGRDKPVATLRQNPSDSVLTRLTLEEIVEMHEKIVRAMGEPPVIVGHSMGGLVAQILLNRGLGASGVAIDSAPPQGVLTTQWSFVRPNWPMLNLLIPSSQPYFMSFAEFQYAFVNGLPEAEQRAAYEQAVVPESRRAWRGALGSIAKIDFSQPHAPLLMVAGSNDHIIPAALNRANYARYKASPSRVDYHEFPGRTHYLLGQPGWEEVADYILDWLDKLSA